MKNTLSTFFFLLLTNVVFTQNTVGTILNDEQAYNGYTLFAPLSSTSTYLIDNCGFIINQWESAYRPGEVAYLLENGNLIRTCRFPSGVFYGGGIGGRIELFDWSGDLLWWYDYRSDEYHAHHDLEVLPNGNILLIAWERKTPAEALAAGRNPNLLEDQLWVTHIVELEPMGENDANIVWEWHFWDHLIQDFDPTKSNYGNVSQHPEKLDINYTRNGGSSAPDWIHANSIDYNPELDQIILNSRHLHEFWIIDHSTTTEEAAGSTGGRWGKGGDILYRWGNPQAYKQGGAADQKTYGQHDVHWIASDLPDAGKVMIFNNGQNRPDGNYSTVDVIEIPQDTAGNYYLESDNTFGPSDLYWTYQANPPTSLYASFVSGAQRLPNGNTLICAGANGRFLEVDMQGNTHWAYNSPVAFGGVLEQGEVPNSQNAVFRAYRYAPDFAAFEGRDLSPGVPIENNPSTNDCSIFVSNEEAYEAFDLWVFPNPTHSFFSIESKVKKIDKIIIFGNMGQHSYEKKVDSYSFNLSVRGWATGVYFIHFYDSNNDIITIKKVVKM